MDFTSIVKALLYLILTSPIPLLRAPFHVSFWLKCLEQCSFAQLQHMIVELLSCDSSLTSLLSKANLLNALFLKATWVLCYARILWSTSPQFLIFSVFLYPKAIFAWSLHIFIHAFTMLNYPVLSFEISLKSPLVFPADFRFEEAEFMSCNHFHTSYKEEYYKELLCTFKCPLRISFSSLHLSIAVSPSSQVPFIFTQLQFLSNWLILSFAWA